MSEIKIGSKVIFKKEYRKIARNLGLKRILTIKSIVDNDTKFVKFKEDGNPNVSVDSNWLKLLKKQKGIKGRRQKRKIKAKDMAQQS